VDNRVSGLVSADFFIDTTGHRHPQDTLVSNFVGGCVWTTGVCPPSVHKVVHGFVHWARQEALMPEIRALTWSYTCRRSAICFPTFSTACITVVWSRPPKTRAIAG